MLLMAVWNAATALTFKKLRIVTIIISIFVSILMSHPVIISIVPISGLSDSKIEFCFHEKFTLKIISMKKPLSSSLIAIIGITLILIAVLSRRLFIRNYSMDSTLSFLAGFAVIVLCFLVLKAYLKNKK